MQITINKIPSVHKQDDITTGIKPVDREKANVEVEKDEIVMKEDFSALYKVHGKKHSKGGTPAILSEGSFVFSNDPTLSLNKEEHEILELKKGGTFRPRKNTPAEVLKRNVDIKHYNKMSATLNDNSKDFIAQNTAALMLGKYQDQIGKVAFAQEAKKNFNQGIPEFAMDSAPIYEDNTKEDIMEQPQYMQFGGTKIPKTGGLWYPTFGGPGFTPRDSFNRLNSLSGFDTIMNSWVNRGMTGIDYVDRPRTYNTPSVVPVTSNKVSRPIGMGQSQDFVGFFPLGNAYDVKGPAPAPKPAPAPTPKPRTVVPRRQTTPAPEQQGTLFPYTPKPKTYNSTMPVGWRELQGKSYNQWSGERVQEKLDTPLLPSIDGQAEQPFDFNAELNWLDKMNIGNALYNAVSNNRYMPMRSQVRTSPIRLNRLDPQAAINQANEAMTSAYGASKVMNPYLASAQNASMYGRHLGALNQITSQYDNQNAQIGNQEIMTNAQIAQQDAIRNAGFDQQYYRETIEGAKNFDDMKTFNRNRVFDVTGNAIEKSMKSQAMNMQLGPNSPYYFDYKNMRVTPNPNRNILNASSSNREDEIKKWLEYFKSNGVPIDVAAKLATAKSVAGSMPSFKRGGKKRR